MITNNQNAINILKQDQLNLDESFVKVLPDGEELTVTSLSMLSKGSIYTSVMKNLEVTVRGDKSHLVDKWLHLTRYIGSANVNNGNVEVLDYGMIAVESYEYDEVADTTTLNCFDGMLLVNQSYNADMLDITFPNTVRNVVLSVASALNLETDINTVPNLDYVVDVDYWVNDLSYTFRDVLNHMAQITTSTISIRENKLTVFEPSDTGLEIEGLNQVLFNGVFGKTNIMAISQQPQNDTYMSPKYATVEGHADFIPFDERKELLFSNNPVMLGKGQEWADELLPRVKDITYNLADLKIYHMAIFEVGDIVTVNGKKVLITEQEYKAQSIIVDLKSSEPLAYQEKYVVETDVQRQGQRTSLEVDKLNGTITALVEQLGGMEDIITQLQIRMGEIELMVKEINNGNLIPNLNGQDGYFGWSGNSGLIVSDELEVQDFMTAGLPAVIKDIDGSEVPSGWQFRNSGELLSPFGYVIPNEFEYSFRGKVGNFKPFTIKLYEYINKPTQKDIYVNVDVEDGSISQNTGDNINSTTRVRSKDYIEVDGGTLFINKPYPNIKYLVRMYDSNHNFISGNQPFKSDSYFEYELNDNTKYVRFVYAYTDDSVIDYKNIPDDVLEVYDKPVEEPTNTQTFDMVGNVQYQQFTTTLKEETRHVQLGFNVPNATLNDPMTLTEMMFNRGKPKAYFESVQDAIAYAKSLFLITSEEISLSNEKIDKVSGNINNAGIKIDADVGIEVYGKHFKVQNQDKTKDIFTVDTIDGEEGVTMVGDLKTIDGDIQIDSKNKKIAIGDVEIRNWISKNQKISLELFTQNLLIGRRNNDDSGIYFYDSSGARRVITRRDNLTSLYVDEINSTGQGTQLFVDIPRISSDTIQFKTLGFKTGPTSTDPVIYNYTGHTVARLDQLSPSVPGYNIGSGQSRYSGIYLLTQPNVSSDLRLKENISPIDDKLIEIFGKEVKPKTYIISGQIHFGYIAQDVERALYKYTLSKYGFTKAKQEVKKFSVLSKSESYMSLLYGEIAVIMDAYNRKRSDDLERRIEKLERMI